MFRLFRKIDGQPVCVNLSHITDLEPAEYAGYNAVIIHMRDRVTIEVFEDFFVLIKEMGCWG